MDWKAEENRPVTPRLLGTQVYKEYDVKDVVDYIDWNPFFQVSTPSALWFNLPLPFLACSLADSIPTRRLSAVALLAAALLPADQGLCLLCKDTFESVIRLCRIVTIQLPAAIGRTCSGPALA